MDSCLEEKPLLVNTQEDLSISTEKRQRQSDVRQILLRGFVIFSFVVARGFAYTCQQEYVYDWIKDNNVGNETRDNGSATNLSSTGPCGENISSSKENENQSIAANWAWYFSLTQNGLGLIAVTIYGLYSDYIGRKPLLVICVIGYTLRTAMMAFIVHQRLHLSYFFIAFAISGVCGSQHTFYMGSMVSVADKTERNGSRSLGLAIVDVLIGTGFGVAQLGTGYLIKYMGYFYPFFIATGILVIILVVLICLTTDTKERSSTKSLTMLVGLKRLFGFFYDKSTIIDGKTFLFNISMLSFLLVYMLDGGIFSIKMLYQMRSPFCWSAELIGWFWFTSFNIRYMVGMLFLKGVQRVMKDEIICLMCIVSSMTSAVIYGLATSSSMLYIASATGLINQLAFPLLRTLCSNMVDTNLQGALFANLFIVEAGCQLFAGTTFNKIYSVTQNIKPGMAFLIGAALFIIPFTLMIYVTVKMKHQRRR